VSALAAIPRKKKVVILGPTLLVMITVMTALGPLVAPYDPIRINPGEALSPPSWQYPFGTDQFGRDILSRTIVGARLSLLTGVGAVCIAVSLGMIFGLASGLWGGWVDLLLMRLVDPTDFTTIGMHSRQIPSNVADGRGFRSEGIRETQVALLAADRVGTAQVAKAANNMIMWSCLIANHEALALAQRHGMDAEKLREALLMSSGDNYVLRNWRQNTMAWAEDDMEIVQQMAAQKGIALPQAGVNREICRMLKPKRFKLDEYGV